MALNRPKDTITLFSSVNILAFLALFTLVFHPTATAIAETLNHTPFGGETILKQSEEGNMFPVHQPDKVVAAVITAYTSTPDQTDDTPFIAASGKRVHDGMIAANWLPFGTIVKIPSLYGDKEFIVEDRMNSRYGYGRMDIWLDTSKAEARKFGVKRVDIEVYYQTKTLVKAK